MFLPFSISLLPLAAPSATTATHDGTRFPGSTVAPAAFFGVTGLPATLLRMFCFVRFRVVVVDGYGGKPSWSHVVGVMR